jgi:hypothetical protein
MKKRLFMVLLITVLAAGAAFATPEFKLSAGAGGFFANDFSGGIDATANVNLFFINIMSIDTKVETPYYGGGGYVFFDATYAEISIGYFTGKVTPKASVKTNGMDMSDQIDDIVSKYYKVSSLNFGLLGKYPIAINDKFSFFPLLGAEYQQALSVKDKDGHEWKNSNNKKAPGDWSSLWFKGGFGMDISFSKLIFLRMDVLYGLRLPTKAEKDIIDEFKKEIKEQMADQPSVTVDVDPKTLQGHGLTAKLAIGFRF